MSMKVNIKKAFYKEGTIPFTTFNTEDYRGITDTDYLSKHNAFGKMNLSYDFGKTITHFLENEIKGIASTENNSLMIKVSEDYIELFVEFNFHDNLIKVYKDGRKSVDLENNHILYYGELIRNYFEKYYYREKLKSLREDINQPKIFCSSADDLYYFLKKGMNNAEVEEYSLSELDKKYTYDYKMRMFNEKSENMSVKEPNEHLFDIEEKDSYYLDPSFKSKKSSEDEEMTSTPTIRAKSDKEPEKLFSVDNLSDRELGEEEVAMIALDPGYVSLSEDKVKLFNKAIENRDNILLVGPTSTGKSTIVHKISNDLQLPLYEVIAHKDAESDRYIGIRELRDGETAFVPGKITLPLMKGGIAFVDEFNFIQPGINMALHSVLDDRRQLEVLELSQEPIKANDDFMFIAAMNEGDEYRGAFELNQATKRRFDLIIRFDYLDEEEEVKVLMKKSGVSDERTAKKIVSVLNMCRKLKEKDELVNPADTGTGIDWLKYADVIGIKEASEYTILETIPSDNEERKLIKEQIRLQFG